MNPIIKYALIGLTVLASLFYIKTLRQELVAVEKNYNDEIINHKATVDLLETERSEANTAYQDSQKLETQLNEVRKQNDAYRDCVIKHNCYVSLRQPTGKKPEQTTTTAPSTVDDTNRLDDSLQQDIFSFREEIELAEIKIVGLQKYILTYCYKPGGH